MLTRINDLFGCYPKKFEYDGKFYRFGDKDKFWAIGCKVNFRGHERTIITFGDWTDPSFTKHTLYSDSDFQYEVEKKKNKKLISLIDDFFKKGNEEREIEFLKNLETFNYEYKDSSKEGTTPYLLIKKISLLPPARISKNKLIIPIVDINNKINSFQFIDNKGNKKFMYGGLLNSSFIRLGPELFTETILFCEGYATGSTLSLIYPEHTIICTLSACRIPTVVKYISQHYPKSKFIICSDKDKSGVGENYSQKALNEVDNAIYVLPIFHQKDKNSQPSDFNDLFCQEGKDEVKRQIDAKIHSFKEICFKKDLRQGFIIPNSKDKNFIRLAEYFDHIYNYFTDEHGVTYIFDKCLFREVSEFEVKSFAEIHFSVNDQKCSKRDAEEFYSLIKRTNFKFDYFASTYENYRFIGFLNGVYDLKNNTLLEHSPKYKLKAIIPHNFEPLASSPTFIKFMNIFSQNRIELINVLQEYLGFCLSGFPYNMFESALILSGDGSNGKSTLVRLIQHLVGSKNSSACVISDLGKNRFLTAQLSKSLVNISEEEPPQIFTNTDYFKKITGGSPLFAEFKGRDGFQFLNRSKLIITYNQLPRVTDFTLGFKRRLLIIPCETNYDKNPELKIKDIDDILKSEISGVINFFLAGLKRLLNQGHFSTGIIIADQIDKLLTKNDPFECWWKSNIQVTNKSIDRISTKALYDHYINYNEGDCGVSQNRFGKFISQKIKNLNENTDVQLQYGPIRISGKDTTVNGVKGIIVSNVIDVIDKSESEANIRN